MRLKDTRARVVVTLGPSEDAPAEVLGAQLVTGDEAAADWIAQHGAGWTHAVAQLGEAPDDECECVGCGQRLFVDTSRIVCSGGAVRCDDCRDTAVAMLRRMVDDELENGHLLGESYELLLGAIEAIARI